jgi:hypothetical protein
MAVPLSVPAAQQHARMAPYAQDQNLAMFNARADQWEAEGSARCLEEVCSDAEVHRPELNTHDVEKILTQIVNHGKDLGGMGQ